ncbi:hypothetical protein QQ056_03570 [Oscillatoria laete-virens NRMC-F 0139]|nr:hypothetical protein [Oscillatoria laete-virens]MDL5052640.1 hypothetical protein [Oscillatoria laete-virens NRMC-F 0139]
MDFLHVEFFQVTIPIINKTYLLTGWKLIGYTGVILFAGRWFVQIWASHHAKNR